MKKGQIPEYSAYLKAYDAKALQLAKRGYTMYDTRLSYEEYKVTYTALRNTRLQEIAAGKRVKATNIMRDLINKQAYQFSRKQAIAQHVAAKELGYKTTLQNLMVGDTKLSDLIKAQADVYKKAGYSSSEIALIISQEYFGSD